MIVTVTMNPAMDKTAMVKTLNLRGLNRLTGVVQDVGGKGINVSKTIAALGGQSVAVGFAAGNTGNSMVEALRKTPGIVPDFLPLPGETRTNLKLVEPNGALTELNEEGPTISTADFEALKQCLTKYATPGTLFVLAGSAAPGAPDDAYRQLIETAHAGGATVFLDADGPQFARALTASPEIIKPNAFELCQYFGREQATVPQLVAMGRELNQKGVGLVCISMGSEGALLVQGGTVLRLPGLKVDCRSSVGAGDAMVAAMAYGLDRGLPYKECFALAVAASAAACMTIGTKPPQPETVKQLQQQVQFLG